MKLHILEYERRLDANSYNSQGSMKLAPDFRTLATMIGTLYGGRGSYPS